MRYRTPAAVAIACTLALAQEPTPPSEEALIETANEVERQVEALRGWKFLRPVEKGVYTEKELREFLAKKIHEELGGGKLERQELILHTLGLLPKGVGLEQTLLAVLMSQIGAFYDPERDSFFMMARTASYGEFVNRMMIAHELTHALDDQYFDIDGLMKEREDEHDAGFAIAAVVEGSATALMYRWSMRYGKDFDINEVKRVAEREKEQMQVLLDAPPYFSTLIARYMAGMAFLTRGKGLVALVAPGARGVADEVKTAFTDPPRSSEQILHPEKYFGEEKDEPVRIVNEDEVVRVLEDRIGARVIERDTLGEIHVALLARPKRKLNPMAMMAAAYWTNPAARGWGGDRVFALRDEEGRTGAVWWTAWDSEKDAREFVAKYRRLHEENLGFEAALAGDTAVFAYGIAKEVGAHDLLSLLRKVAEFGR